MKYRQVALVAVLVAAVFAGIIWLSSQYESGSFRKIKQNEKERTLTVELKPAERHEYIVYCNEERFRDAFKDFHQFIDAKADAVAVPGGPLVIALTDVDLGEDLQAPKRAAVEILKRHMPDRIILVAHEGCLLDDTIGAWLDDPRGVRLRQYQNLYRARTVITSWFPKTTVEIFYGENVGSDQMRFFPVPDDSLVAAAQAAATETGPAQVHSK